MFGWWKNRLNDEHNKMINQSRSACKYLSDKYRSDPNRVGEYIYKEIAEINSRIELIELSKMKDIPLGAKEAKQLFSDNYRLREIFCYDENVRANLFDQLF